MTYFTDRSRKIQWSSEETQKLSHTHAAHMNTLNPYNMIMEI